MRVQLMVVGVLLLGNLACYSTTSPNARVLEHQTSASMSVGELRIRVRDLARPFAGAIELTADRILEGTGDPELRRQALKVKTEAIPALFQALYRKDPGAALIDAAAFVEQLRQDFSSRYQDRLTPEQLKLIDETADGMKQKLQAIYLNAGATREEVEEIWARIEAWAEKHPIKGNFGIRVPTSDLAAIASASKAGGLAGSIASTEEDLADFASRADLYAEFLPRQSRWQAEILVDDMLRRGVVGESLRTFQPVDIAVTELPIEPEVLREELIDDLRREGLSIGSWLHAERIDSLRFLREERLAVMEQLKGERMEIQRALAEEREQILAEISREREASFRDLESIISSAVEQSRKDLIDHFFVRTAELLALVLPLVFLGVFVLLRFGRKS